MKIEAKFRRKPELTGLIVNLDVEEILALRQSLKELLDTEHHYRVNTGGKWKSRRDLATKLHDILTESCKEYDLENHDEAEEEEDD